MHVRFRPALLPLLFATAWAATLPANAQTWGGQEPIKGMDERFRLDVGGFFQKFETSVRIDASNGTPGSEISLEKDLGLDSNQVSFRADGYWRFGRHARLDFGYRGWNRTKDRVLDRDLQIGDQTFHAGAQTSTQIKVTVVDVYYAYSFVNNGVVEAGLGLGVSAYFNKFAIDATGSASGAGGSGNGTFSSESRNLIAPIPALQANLSLTLLPRFFLRAKAKGVKATISGYSGSMVDAIGALDIYFTKNVGIGGGYNYVKLIFEQASDGTVSNAIRLDYVYSGPIVYATVAF